MARVPYQPVPDVEPRVQQPQDYERIQATPAAFGAAIGEGAEKFGQGAVDASQFWGEVQTDTAVNTALTSANQAISHYKSLNGQDALDAQQPTQDAIDRAFKTGRDSLKTPDQQYRFDTVARNYQQRYFAGQISSHADQAAKAFAHTNNQNTLQNALTTVTNAPDDPNVVKGAMATARQATFRDLQIEGMANDPDAVKAAFQRSDAAVIKTRLQTIAVKDPAGAAKLVDNFQNMLGPDYAPLANEFRTRAAQQNGNAAAADAWSTSSHTASPAAPTADAAQLIQKFEGFRPNSYWDVNHYRTGYGSDTITLPDGSVQPVTKDTVVTQADADRDLQRRVRQTQGQIIGDVGGQAWSQMSPAMQASLTSVAYNYGHLPSSVAFAVQSGNPTAVSQAIYSLHGDNGGVNAGRRAQEAANALRSGGFGAGETLAPAPGVQPPVSTAGNPPSGPAPAPANENISPPSAPALPQSPEEQLAAAYQRLDADPRLVNDPQAMEAAKRAVNEHYQMQAVEASATVKARKDASDKSSNQYITQLLTGDVSPQLVQQIANDPNLLPETRLSLGNAAIKQAAEATGGDVRSYGPGFWGAYQAITAAPGDPNRIGDVNALLKRAGPGGDLTLAGVSKLSQMMAAGQRSVNDQAVNQAKRGLIAYGRSKITFEAENAGTYDLRDPKGVALFNGTFIPKFEAAYDQWTKDGKDPWQFLNRDNVDKLMNGIRSPSQMAADKVSALGQEGAGPGEDKNAPLPPAPEGVDTQGWTTVIGRPPSLQNGVQATHAQWAQAIEALRSNPDEKTKAAFDRWMGASGYTADKVLDTLTPKPPAPPGEPLNERIGDWFRSRPFQ